MFLKSSRYFGLETVELTQKDGKSVTAVKFRRIPPTAGAAYSVGGGDRLDMMAMERYGMAAKYWHIADANTELEASDLVAAAGRVIYVPEQ
jgi:hypothetical protein